MATATKNTIRVVDLAKYISSPPDNRPRVARSVVEMWASDYSPAKDHYGPHRRALVKSVQAQSVTPLRRALGRASPKKEASVLRVLEGTERWFHRDAPVPIDDGLHVDWSAGPHDIRVNPELVVEMGGDRWALKVDFKVEPMSPRELEVVTRLIDECFVDSYGGVLEARTGRIRRPTRFPRDIDLMIAADAASLGVMIDLL